PVPYLADRHRADLGLRRLSFGALPLAPGLAVGRVVHAERLHVLANVEGTVHPGGHVDRLTDPGGDDLVSDPYGQAPIEYDRDLVVRPQEVELHSFAETDVGQPDFRTIFLVGDVADVRLVVADLQPYGRIVGVELLDVCGPEDHVRCPSVGCLLGSERQADG